MKIAATRECNINGVKILPGARNYDTIDHKDMLTAVQLNILRNVGAIDFNEIVKPVTMDDYINAEKAKEKAKSNVGKPQKTTGQAGQSDSGNSGGRAVPDKVKNKSTKRRIVSK